MGCDSASATGDKQEKIQVIFVVGGPGSGKGTQCAKIKDQIKYEHLSTGDILRNVVKEQKDPKWQELKEKMDKGDFVPSSDLIGFVKTYLNSLKNKKVLLDGFPRNQENVDEWNKQMKEVCDLKGVLYFNCSPEEMKKRMLGRNEGRSDDKEDVMQKRIDNFIKDTMPLTSQFTEKLIEVNALQTVDEVFEEAKKKLQEKGIC